MPTSYKDLPQETKEAIPDETRQALHSLRDEMQVMLTKLEIYMHRADILEQLVKDHHASCLLQKEENKQLLEIMQAIKSGMKLTNFLRDCIVWSAGLLASSYGAIQIIKEFMK